MSTFSAFSASSFLRVFASPRDLTGAEVERIHGRLSEFLGTWVSHDATVPGAFEIVADRFIVVGANEEQAPISGCSKDSLVGVIRELGAELAVELVHGPPIHFRGEGGIESVDRAQFGQLVEKRVVDGQTPVFDTIVGSVGAYRDEGFERPAAASWHARAWDLAATD